MFTNSLFSKAFNIPISKVRRWTKEFLPPDPRATRRSGYTREFSINEAYYIYLGGWMISNWGWTFAKARAVLEKIWPWMEKNGMVPIIQDWAKREGIDADIHRYDKLGLFFHDKTDAFETLQVMGLASSWDFSLKSETDSLGREYWKNKNEKIMYMVFEGEAGGENWSRKTLSIQHHLERFLWNIDPGGEHSLMQYWEYRFLEIADSDKGRERFKVFKAKIGDRGISILKMTDIFDEYDAYIERASLTRKSNSNGK